MELTIAEQLEAEFNRINISKRDFLEAVDYLKNLKGKRNFTVKRALLLSAIISYCRPFSPNERVPTKNAVSRIPINLEKELSSSEVLLHEKLITLRNKALAHSEYAHKPTRRVMATPTGFLTSSMPFDILSERIDIKALQDLSQKLYMCCERVLFELSQKMGPKA